MQLLPGAFTPSLVESMVRLGTWMPFAPGAAMVEYFVKVDLSAATVRRNTEKSGQAYMAVQTAAVETLERETPEAPAGPAVQQMSVDGAMVPLVGGEWAEVKTLAIGTVEQHWGQDGQVAVHTGELSYFSRLADADTFGRLATVETQRRGTEKAGLVCFVVDGAEWEQKFGDLHCPKAVRILDWPHGAEYVVKAGQAAFGPGTAELAEWLAAQLHELRHGEPKRVLQALEALWVELALAVAAGAPKIAALLEVESSLAYLSKRREQIRYAEFAAQGYPIGSGIVESANKLVVEARLKGAGMHWARAHVNPLVALRTVVCSDRWDEAWAQIAAQLRQEQQQQATERRNKRQAAKVAQTPACVGTVTTADVSVAADAVGVVAAVSEAVAVLTAVAKAPVVAQELAASTVAAAKDDSAGPSHTQGEQTCLPRKPAPDHIWRRLRIGKGVGAEPRRPASAES